MKAKMRTFLFLAASTILFLTSCGIDPQSKINYDSGKASSISFGDIGSDESGSSSGPVFDLDHSLDSEEIGVESAKRKGLLKKNAAESGENDEVKITIGGKNSKYNITAATLVYGLTADNNGSTVDLAFKADQADGVLCWWEQATNSSNTYAPSEGLTVEETTKKVNKSSTTSYHITTTYEDGGSSGYVSLNALNQVHESLSTQYTGYFCFGSWMHAWRFTDYVYARAYKVTPKGDGDYQIDYSSSVVKYSVLDYSYNMYDSSDETAKGYIDDIKDIGAKAQDNKSYNETRPADGEYYRIKVKGAKLVDRFSSGLYNESESVELQRGTYSNWYDGVSAYSSNSIAVSSLLSDHTASELASGITFSNVEVDADNDLDSYVLCGYAYDMAGNPINGATVSGTLTISYDKKETFSVTTSEDGYYQTNIFTKYKDAGTWSLSLFASFMDENNVQFVSGRTIDVVKYNNLGRILIENFVLCKVNTATKKSEIIDEETGMHQCYSYYQSIETTCNDIDENTGLEKTGLTFSVLYDTGYLIEEDDELSLQSYWDRDGDYEVLSVEIRSQKNFSQTKRPIKYSLLSDNEVLVDFAEPALVILNGEDKTNSYLTTSGSIATLTSGSIATTDLGIIQFYFSVSGDPEVSYEEVPLKANAFVFDEDVDSITIETCLKAGAYDPGYYLPFSAFIYAMYKQLMPYAYSGQRSYSFDLRNTLTAGKCFNISSSRTAVYKIQFQWVKFSFYEIIDIDW